MCFDRKWNTVPNQGTGNREGSLYIFSSNLFNILIFISNRSSPVTVDRRQFHEERLFSYFTILSVMSAVTFPLRPPRLAFAICGRRWENDVFENKV